MNCEQYSKNIQNYTYLTDIYAPAVKNLELIGTKERLQLTGMLFGYEILVVLTSFLAYSLYKCNKSFSTNNRNRTFTTTETEQVKASAPRR